MLALGSVTNQNYYSVLTIQYFGETCILSVLLLGNSVYQFTERFVTVHCTLCTLVFDHE